MSGQPVPTKPAESNVVTPVANRKNRKPSRPPSPAPPQQSGTQRPRRSCPIPPLTKGMKLIVRFTSTTKLGTVSLDDYDRPRITFSAVLVDGIPSPNREKEGSAVHLLRGASEISIAKSFPSRKQPADKVRPKPTALKNAPSTAAPSPAPNPNPAAADPTATPSPAPAASAPPVQPSPAPKNRRALKANPPTAEASPPRDLPSPPPYPGPMVPPLKRLVPPPPTRISPLSSPSRPTQASPRPRRSAAYPPTSSSITFFGQAA